MKWKMQLKKPKKKDRKISINITRKDREGHIANRRMRMSSVIGTMRNTSP